VGVLGVVVIAAGGISSFLYGIYWKPARDLQDLGFSWIKPWTPREWTSDHWLDGSQALYRFAITEEREAELRQTCAPPKLPNSKPTLCFVARKVRVGESTIDVSVERRSLILTYTTH
jgi:hypothetical protein